MQQPRTPTLTLQQRIDERRQAERVAALAEPRYPATGTARISALVAEARRREQAERRDAARARRRPSANG